MKKRLISVIAMLAMLVAMLSVNAFAADTDSAVAQIGDDTYATLDEALAAASDGDTITVLQSTTVSKINLRNSNYGGIDIDLTIKGAEGVNPTITFTDAGIQTSSHTLTLEDCTIVMNDLQAPNVSWGTIFFDTGGTMNLNNVTMTLDGTNAPSGGANAIYTHGIYFYGSNTLNVTNSTVTIQNYPQDALEWSGDYPDGNRATYDLNIVNSTFICDNNRSGLAGTFDMKIDNSTVKVTDSTGNGSNGTYYTITNNSYVEFTGNRNWGISAYRIDMSNDSTLIASDNGYSGVWVRILNVDGTSTLDVERNGNHGTGSTTNAGIFFQGNGSYTSTIEAGADVTIKNNAGSGIYTNQSVCNLTVNAAAVITNNGTGEADTYNGYGAKYGGGVYNVGTLVLCDDVVIYNNHASEAGDDIYSNGAKSITFGDVNSNATWVLDDCNHVIDGWYEDGYEEHEVEVTSESEDGETTTETTIATERWSANCENEGYTYAEVKDSGTYTTTIAYKAAHGVEAKVTEPGLTKTIVDGDSEKKQDDVAAGDTVDYKLLSTIPSTLTEYITYTYDEETSTAVGTVNSTTDTETGETVYDTYTLTFHDSVADGLTVDTSSIEVYVGGEELDSKYYTVTTSDLGDDCTFEVSMDLLALYTADVINEADFGRTSITVTYSATLSEDATAGAYTNTAWVSYLDKTSEEDQVEVDTYGISIFKYDQSDSTTDDEGNTTYAGLPGATFELRMQVSEDTEGALTDSEGNSYVVVDTLTSGDDGYITVKGLDAGTYYLKETEAPEGYVKADTVLTVNIPENIDDETFLASVEFANAPIPSTGGMGTTMYTAAGICIILAAGLALVVTRKTRRAE